MFDQPVRVLLSDDHPSILDALTQRLAHEPDVQVVGAAGSVGETLAQEALLRPDLVVLNLVYDHEVRGIELLRTLRARRAGLRLLVFSGQDERVHAEHALRAGAAGYVMKNAPLDEVCTALRRMVRGEVYTSDVVARSLVRSLVHGGGGDPTAFALRRLTPQERAVLAMVGRGMDTGAMAQALGISRKTAQTHRRRVQRKMGFAQPSQLVHFATLMGSGAPGDAK